MSELKKNKQYYKILFEVISKELVDTKNKLKNTNQNVDMYKEIYFSQVDKITEYRHKLTTIILLFQDLKSIDTEGVIERLLAEELKNEIIDTERVKIIDLLLKDTFYEYLDLQEEGEKNGESFWINYV